MASLFISYSRKDIEIAHKLTKAFEGQGLDFWIDWEGIPPTVDWWKEIEKGIEAADIFLFLLSPDSTKSNVCKREIDHAVKNGKRLIPVVVRDIKGDDSLAELSSLNWIFLRKIDDFKIGFKKLVTAIKTDYEWVQAHSQLQVKALEWERSNQENSFLLRGKELRDAESQLATNTSKEPLPTDLQREYVLKSRQAADRQRRITTIIATAGIIALASLAVFGFAQAKLATDKANIALARQLAAQAQSLNTTGNTKQATAILLATQSMKLFPSGEAAEILWNASLGPRSISRIAFEDAVTSVAFSPDGKYVVSGSDDTSIHVWETSTGKEIARMLHGNPVSSVAFSPDGIYVVSGSTDYTARVWATATGKEVAAMDHDFWVNSVAFSPDGKYVVSGSADDTARVWDAATGEEVARMTHGNHVTSVAFSPDGKYVVSGSNDNSARVWDAATGEEVARMTHESYVTSVVFSPDGKYVVSGSNDNSARVWDAATGEEVARLTHESYVTSVAFSPDGKFIVSGSWDDTARVWETATGNEVARMVSDDYVDCVSFSPDGTYIASGSQDGTARVLAISTGKEVTRMTYDGGVTSIAFSRDGKYVLSGSQDGTARVWEVLLSKPAVRISHDAPVTSIAFSPDGKLLLSGSTDGTAHLQEVASGKEIARMIQLGAIYFVAFSPDGRYMLSEASNTVDGNDTAIVWEASTGKEVSRMSQDQPITRIAFSPDGKYIVSGSLYGTAIVWEAGTGREVASMSDEVSVNTIVFSPTGNYVLFGGCDNTPFGNYGNSECLQGTARVWEVSTGREISRMTHESSVFSAAFSPDGKYVVSGGWDGIAIIWEAATGNEIARLGHNGVVAALAFSSDGRTVLSGECQETSNGICIQGTIRVWSSVTGKEIVQMNQDGAVSAIAFSPDGKYVLWGGCEEEVSYYDCTHGTVQVWEAATGKEIANMAQDGAAISVAVSPNGKYVASGSWENAASIWMWRPEDVITDTCSRLNHNLTRAEWERYIGDALPYQAVCSELPVEPAPRVVLIHNMNEYYGWILLWVTMLYLTGGWIAYRAIFSYPGSPSRFATSAFTWRRFVIASAQGALLITLIFVGLFIPTWLIFDQMVSREFSPSPFVILFLLPAGLWAGGAYSHFTRFQSGRLSRTKRTILGSMAGLFGIGVWSLILMLMAILLFQRSISIGDYFWVEMLQIAAILGGISGVLSAFGALFYIFGIQKWLMKSVTHKQVLYIQRAESAKDESLKP